MKQLNLFIELTRLKKPIGFMLLFWPCAWGLTIAYDFSNDIKIYSFYQFENEKQVKHLPAAGTVQ